MTSRSRRAGELCHNCNKRTHSENHYRSLIGNYYCNEACWRERAQSDMEFVAKWRRENRLEVEADQEAFDERIKEL